MQNELPDETWTAIRWLIGVLVTGFSSVMLWIAKDKIDQNQNDHLDLRKDHEALDARLRFLEANIVKKGDIDYLGGRLDAIQRDNTVQNNMILKELLTHRR